MRPSRSAELSGFRLPLLVSLGLAALVVAVFWGSGTHGFLNFDDGEYVSENAHVAAGLTAAGVRWAFTAFHAANWHPVTWLSHMLDVEFFGMNAGAMHRVNVALHLANTLLLFAVLRRWTGALWRSAFVAALFGVHPLHVESVAWISERKDVLSTFFLLATIFAYAEWTRRRRFRWLAAALAACAFGLMSKPMLVTTPLLLLLIDAWPLRRFDGASAEARRRILLEKIPFVLLAVGAAVATWVAQSRGGAMAAGSTFPLAQRIANAVVSYARYLVDTVWPARLAVFYPHPASVGDGVPAISWVSSAALLVVLTGIVVRERSRRPWLAFGWAWYLVSLAPVIGLIQVGSQARADRYTYVSLVGVFVAIAWTAAELVRRFRVPRAVVATAAAATLGALALAARVQNGYWTDEVSLDAHAIAVTHANWVAWNNLGKHWMDTDLPRAAGCFRRAIGYKEDYDVAWFNLGVVQGGLGQDAGAIASYRRSLDLDPANVDGWANLSFEYLTVGNRPAAAAAAEQARRLRPDDPSALAALALSRAALGDRAGAERPLDRLRAVDPGLARRVAASLPAR
ncbi:MAG TPA: tetratricopeptide repeat protein [Thermoanaerobaculia bacterium]|nr:tetratricopeptide repeat protein [Thermoanaerobaculia bacterium]